MCQFASKESSTTNSRSCHPPALCGVNWLYIFSSSLNNEVGVGWGWRKHAGRVGGGRRGGAHGPRGVVSSGKTSGLLEVGGWSNLSETVGSHFVTVFDHLILPWHSRQDWDCLPSTQRSPIWLAARIPCGISSVSWALGWDLQLCLLGSLWIVSAQTENLISPSGIFCQILCFPATSNHIKLFPTALQWNLDAFHQPLRWKVPCPAR